MRSNFLLPPTGSIWSPEKIQTLRRLAHEGLSVKEIALAMRRTESSIRNKAGMHGISLKGASHGRRAPAAAGLDAESGFVATLAVPIA